MIYFSGSCRCALKQGTNISSFSSHPAEDINNFILVHTVLISLRWRYLWWETAAEETQPFLSSGLRRSWLEFLCDESELLPPMAVNCVRKTSMIQTNTEGTSQFSHFISSSLCCLCFACCHHEGRLSSLNSAQRSKKRRNTNTSCHMTGRNIIQGYCPVPLSPEVWDIMSSLWVCSWLLDGCVTHLGGDR